MSDHTLQTTLIATLGMAASFALGTVFGDAVYPASSKCTTPQLTANTLSTPSKPDHPEYWTASPQSPANDLQKRWHDAAVDPQQTAQDDTLECTPEGAFDRTYCWPKDISPLSGPK